MTTVSRPAPVGADDDERGMRQTRDRERRIKVAVNDAERAEIERRAGAAGLPVSAYLRAAGLNHPVKSVLDYRVASDLIDVAGNLGRLGGLLKLWLAERRGEGASVGDVNRLLRETRELQAQIRALASRV